jgi:hypothetical protein
MLGLQSFKARQIAAIMQAFQWFAHYVLFAHVASARTEDVDMSDRPANSTTLLAAFASFALVAASASPSAAASTAPATKSAAASPAALRDATDFSAAKRRQHYRRGPSAAGLAVMGAAAGIIGGAIAQSQRRDYYEDRYYYDRGPGYYGGPANYGGSNYYRGPNRPSGPYIPGGYCAGGGPSAVCGNFDR